jgi:hypothetical protein
MSSAAPILSLSLSGALNYLDPSTSKPIRVVSGHQKTVKALGTTGDASTILSASYDGRVCAWDVATGDAHVVSETEGNVVQFTASEKKAWSVSSVASQDLLKEIDVTNKSYEYIITRLSNGRGLSVGIGGSPAGVSSQNGNTIFVATKDNIQVFQNGKKVVQEAMKTPKTPSAIAANPAVPGEFAVGAEVDPDSDALTTGFNRIYLHPLGILSNPQNDPDSLARTSHVSCVFPVGRISRRWRLVWENHSLLCVIRGIHRQNSTMGVPCGANHQS